MCAKQLLENPPLEKVEPNLYQKVLPRSLLKNNKFGSTFSKGGLEINIFY